jgi:GTP cyclohydrolase IA
MNIEKNIEQILKKIDPYPKRPDLLGTPKRVAQALEFLTEGFHIDIKKVFEQAVFQTNDEDMIIIQAIEFYSLCEHHLLPFFGECHIAYLPQKNILGLSKFGQIQERLTTDIAHCIFEELRPRGVGVMMKGHHLCMKMRGIQKQNPLLITQKMLGALQEPHHQMIFFNAIQNTHQKGLLNEDCGKSLK